MSRLKKILNIVKYKYADKQWNIAICDLQQDLQPINIRWLKHNYSDRWFADPFLIEEDKMHYVVLVEEFMYDTGKGRIARLTIDKKTCRLIKNECLLDLPTHLSFPNFIKHNGIIYVIPENSRSGATYYYNYNDGMKCEGVLVYKPLTDAVIASFHDEFLIFTTQSYNCNGNVCELFHARELFGPYEKKQDICFVDNIARGAGHIFKYGNHWIRPAQICNNDYGEGICLQKIVTEGEKIILQEIKRILPPSKEYADGFHTYNVFGNSVVIDGYYYKSKFVKSIYDLLIRVVLKFYHLFQ